MAARKMSAFHLLNSFPIQVLDIFIYLLTKFSLLLYLNRVEIHWIMQFFIWVWVGFLNKKIMILVSGNLLSSSSFQKFIYFVLNRFYICFSPIVSILEWSRWFYQYYYDNFIYMTFSIKQRIKFIQIYLAFWIEITGVFSSWN